MCAAERKRACGYRKVGGTYLVSDAGGMPCGRLPIELTVCPCCGAGVKQGRGWQWVDPAKLMGSAACDHRPPNGVGSNFCGQCPAANPALMGERAGLLWIGEAFYPRASDFDVEAGLLGISRRIAAVPRGFRVGEHWVLLAHPKAIRRIAQNAAGEEIEQWVPGIFRLWKPQRVERIVTDEDAKDAKLLTDLLDKGITPVIVPADDPDHRGSAHDIPAKDRRQQELGLEDA